MSIEAEDVAALLEEVGQFTQGRIAEAVMRPENPLPNKVLEQLTGEALELGILPAPTREAGFGLWEAYHQPHIMRFNIGVLRLVGSANAGIAFAWHRQALARVLEREMGWTPAFEAGAVLGVTMLPTGHYGLGRTNLARWLGGRVPEGDEREILQDWLDRTSHPTILTAPAGWNSLLWPVWRDDRIGWERVSRAALNVGLCSAQHGLDELSTFQMSREGERGELCFPLPDMARQLFARVFKMDMIGLLAIGAGAITRAWNMAKDYAGIRQQGGKLIGRHPAVQQMLCDVELCRHSVEQALLVCERPVDMLDTNEVAAMRARLSGLLCQAASQVVQVFGGLGYMRDNGAEKILRDMNMLKAQTGGAWDLRSFVAGWCGDFA